MEILWLRPFLNFPPLPQTSSLSATHWTIYITGTSGISTLYDICNWSGFLVTELHRTSSITGVMLLYCTLYVAGVLLEWGSWLLNFIYNWSEVFKLHWLEWYHWVIPTDGWYPTFNIQSSFTVQNLLTPLAKIGHVIFRSLATQHVFRALLTIMHGKRALFKFQNGNPGSELRLYIKSVRDLKFLFCLHIHALANRTMNPKFSIMNSASPRSLLNFSFIVRLARACIRKQNAHNSL